MQGGKKTGIREEEQLQAENGPSEAEKGDVSTTRSRNNKEEKMQLKQQPVVKVTSRSPKTSTGKGLPRFYDQV